MTIFGFKEDHFAFDSKFQRMYSKRIKQKHSSMQKYYKAARMWHLQIQKTFIHQKKEKIDFIEIQ